MRPSSAGGQRLAVEGRRLHLGAAVDERRRTCGGVEPHRADGPERGTLEQVGEVDGDVVGGDRQKVRALDRLLLSKAADGHGCGPHSRSGALRTVLSGRRSQPRAGTSAVASVGGGGPQNW